MTVAPLVVKGNVIVGMSGAEYPTRLYIEALNSEANRILKFDANTRVPKFIPTNWICKSC